MRFFKINLRIKSKTLNIQNTKPIYQKLKISRHIMAEIHTVKHVIHEKSFNKNLVLKLFVNDLFILRYSI